MPLIFIISGKAQAGKDTTANFIKEYALNNNLKTINLQFSSYIKMYAKGITNWDGSEDNKPRTLLQSLGEDIRTNIDKYFFINRIKEDIIVYSNYFNIITISDARLPEELDKIKEFFPKAIKIHIIRPNFNPYKTVEEKNHPTELALDNYQKFEYLIENDSTLDNLKMKVNELLNSLNVKNSNNKYL